MSLDKHSLFLLDLPGRDNRIAEREFFQSLADMVLASFDYKKSQNTITDSPPEKAGNYSLLSRMSRVDYHSQARAEALMKTLQQIRTQNAAQGTPKKFFRQA